MAYCSTHGDYHTICVPCALNQHNQDTIYGAGPSDSSYPPGSTKDNINPDYYRLGGIECIDAINEVVQHLDGMEAMCTGNAIKYLWRWKHKNGFSGLLLLSCLCRLSHSVL